MRLLILILVCVSVVLSGCKTAPVEKTVEKTVEKLVLKQVEPEDSLSHLQLMEYKIARQEIEEYLIKYSSDSIIAFVQMDRVSLFMDIASNIDAVQTSLGGLSQRDRMVLARKLNVTIESLMRSGKEITLALAVDTIKQRAKAITDAVGEEF